jgi:hypothetical protein
LGEGEGEGECWVGARGEVESGCWDECCWWWGAAEGGRVGEVSVGLRVACFVRYSLFPLAH